MAVTRPRVGSSAFAETGFREMSKAREKLRLVARPGKLSEMIGKSVYNFKMVVGKADYYQATLVGYNNFRPECGKIINGSWPGGLSLTQMAASDRGSAGGTLNLNGAVPRDEWNTILDGITFKWVKQRGINQYTCTTDVHAFFQARVGRTIDVIVL